jgi:hypothetical protein
LVADKFEATFHAAPHRDQFRAGEIVRRMQCGVESDEVRSDGCGVDVPHAGRAEIEVTIRGTQCCGRRIRGCDRGDRSALVSGSGTQQRNVQQQVR